jgi:hypothetical protein
MFKTTTLLYEKGSTDLHHLDLTGDLKDDLHVEVMHAAGGHQVLYVHNNGNTMIRICRPKSITMNDRRPQTAMTWEQWQKDVHDGYYWVENLSFQGKPIHRILEIIEIKPGYEGAQNGQYRDGWVRIGYYVNEGDSIQNLEYYKNWDGFKAIRIEPPVFE